MAGTIIDASRAAFKMRPDCVYGLIQNGHRNGIPGRTMSSSGQYIEQLMAWYAEHRDDEWEHRHGLKLEASEDGEWLLIIDTKGTELEGYTRELRRLECSQADWFDWRFEASGFRANGGARNVGDMIGKFFDALEGLATNQTRA